MQVEITEVDLTPAMLEIERAKDMDLSLIGASDTPIIMGTNRWGSEEELQRRILEGAEFEARPAAYWGSVMEPAIVSAYARGRGMPYKKPGSVRHPRGRQWQRVSLDAISDDGATLIEAKCVSEHRWYDEFNGGLELPESIVTQVQTQMEAVDVDEAVVLISRWDEPGRLWETVLTPDKDRQREIVEKAFLWHKKHIIGKEPVAPAKAKPILPTGSRKLEVEDGSRLDEIFRRLAALRAERLTLEALEKTEKAELTEAMIALGIAGAKHHLGSSYTTTSSTKREVSWEEVALLARGRFSDSEWAGIVEAATKTKTREGFVGVRLK